METGVREVPRGYSHVLHPLPASRYSLMAMMILPFFFLFCFLPHKITTPPVTLPLTCRSAEAVGLSAESRAGPSRRQPELRSLQLPQETQAAGLLSLFSLSSIVPLCLSRSCACPVFPPLHTYPMHAVESGDGPPTGRYGREAEGPTPSRGSPF